MKNIQSRTILFITGAFVSTSCWDTWQDYFTNRGFKTLAPPWPYKERPAATLRRTQPNAKIASIRLKSLIDHYSSIAKKLSETPIVIGHSLGGLIVQILVNRGLAAAGVCIHALAPQGVIPTQFSFIKSTWRALGYFTSTRKAYMMSFKSWQYAFTNGMPLIAQRDGYNQFAIPESKLVLRDGLTSAAKVDFKKPHVPLLFVAGSIDHCIPAALNLKNVKRYKDKNSTTDFKEFEGRNHFVLGQPTWREDADYIINWIGNSGSNVRIVNTNNRFTSKVV